MTREELKRHCLKQIEDCEMWARLKGEEPHGKIYEEHKLILELLEQEPFINKPCVSGEVCEHDKQKGLDKIRAEIKELDVYYVNDFYVGNRDAMFKCNEVLHILDKYKADKEQT